MGRRTNKARLKVFTYLSITYLYMQHMLKDQSTILERHTMDEIWQCSKETQAVRLAFTHFSAQIEMVCGNGNSIQLILQLLLRLLENKLCHTFNS